MSLRSIHKSYKVEINPTQRQKEILNKNFGCVRFVYNWCIERFQKESKKDKSERLSFSKYQYIREFNQFKKNNEEYSFLNDKDISSVALQQSVLNFSNSVNRFFQTKYGFPQFKKKGICRDSYREFNINIQRSDDKKGSLKTFERRIHIPKLGWTKIKGKPEKYLLQNKTISSITLYRDIDKYFISIYYVNDITLVDDNIESNPNFEVIGIDLGIKNLMTICHDDESMEIIDNNDFTKKYKDKLCKEQQKLSKKQKGSNNRKKQQIKVAKIHRKIRYSRIDKIHKITNYITSKTKNSIIMMEDLTTKHMIMNGNKNLSKSLSNVSFCKIIRQIDYKSLLNGSRLDLIPSNYPSTKLCSGCGNIMDIDLNQREYQCDNSHCIYHINPIDRDYNSSINIRDYYFKYPRQAMA